MNNRVAFGFQPELNVPPESGLSTLVVGRVAPGAPAFGCRVSVRPEVAYQPR